MIADGAVPDGFFDWLALASMLGAAAFESALLLLLPGCFSCGLVGVLLPVSVWASAAAADEMAVGDIG